MFNRIRDGGTTSAAGPASSFWLDRSNPIVIVNTPTGSTTLPARQYAEAHRQQIEAFKYPSFPGLMSRRSILG